MEQVSVNNVLTQMLRLHQVVCGYTKTDEGTEIPIENKLVNRSIEASQSKVEGYHFEIRKQLVEYDDVGNMTKQQFSERKQTAALLDLDNYLINRIARM